MVAQRRDPELVSLESLFSLSTEGRNVSWNVSMPLALGATEQLSAWLWSCYPETSAAVAPENPSVKKISWTKWPWRPGTAFKEYQCGSKGQWNIPLLGQFLPSKFILVRDTSGDTMESVAYKSNTKLSGRTFMTLLLFESTNVIRQMVTFPFQRTILVHGEAEEKHRLQRPASWRNDFRVKRK